MASNKVDITIIGAGLTGLTTAFYLVKAGFKVLVLEKTAHTGGVINTRNKKGFVYETGPNTGIIGTADIVELFNDLKEDISPEIANPKSKSRWILKNGKWNALPSGLFQAIATPLFTMRDKLRILGEPFRKAGKNENESVADLVKRRLGKSYLDYAVDPFISGIYAGDPEKLITRFALPKLYNLDHQYGSFIRGAIKKKKEPKTEIEKKVSREVFSIRGGLYQLIKSLEKRVGSDHIYTEVSNIQTVNEPDGFKIKFRQSSGEEQDVFSTKLISTIGGIGLAQLLPFVSKEEMEAISNTEYARVVQLVACYNNWKGIPLNAFGGLIPSKENKKSLGVLFTSSIFKDRAPEGGAVISVFMGGMRNPDMIDKTDDEIKDIAMRELEETLGSDQKPEFLEIFRYTHAIPQYTINTEERLMTIDKVEQKFPGLIIAGNLKDGIGMADRIKQAKNLAEKLINGNRNAGKKD